MTHAGFYPARLADVRTAMQRFIDEGQVAGIVMLTWRARAARSRKRMRLGLAISTPARR